MVDFTSHFVQSEDGRMCAGLRINDHPELAAFLDGLTDGEKFFVATVVRAENLLHGIAQTCAKTFVEAQYRLMHQMAETTLGYITDKEQITEARFGELVEIAHKLLDASVEKARKIGRALAQEDNHVRH